MAGIAPDGRGQPWRIDIAVGPLAIWSAVLVAVAAADAAAVPGAPAGVAVGALAAALLLRPFGARALPTILALIPLVVEPGGGPTWILAGAALMYATSADTAAPAPGAALRRQLAVCRRREMSATVLVVPVERRAVAERVLEALRSTDTAEILRVTGRPVVVAVLDDDELDRDRLQARLAAAAALPLLPCGWTRFPDHGVTLEVLVEHGLTHVPDVPQPQRGSRAAERRLSLAERSP